MPFDLGGKTVPLSKLSTATKLSRKRRHLVVAAESSATRSTFEGLESRTMMSVAPTGPEFQVNGYTPANQLYPSVTADADGDFTVAWESEGQDGSGYGVYFQRYNAGGAPLGGPVRAADTTFGNQFGASVGMDDAGNLVVAWASEFQDGSGYGIFARRFDSAGNALGNEFQVNTVTADDQTDPSVAVDPDGDFVIAWQSYGPHGTQWEVAARRFNAAGVAQGAEFPVNTTTTGVQAFPSVATDDAGGFVIAWHSNAAGNYDVVGRAYDAAGTALTGEIPVNSTTAGDQSYPDVDRDAAGNTVVVWRSDGQDGDGAGVFARRFSAAGVAGPEFQVNTTTAGDQSFPAVSVEDDGDFVVTWYSENQDVAGGNGVYARHYTAAGAPNGGETRINTFTAGNQEFPDIAGDGSGNYAIAWSSEDQDAPGGYGIFARQVQASVVPPDTTAPTVDIVDVTPDPRTTPVDSMTIVFSEPVTGFDISDLQFFRGATVVPLTGATLTTTDNQTYVLGNLAPLTQVAGDYALFLNAATAGITDAAGNALTTSATDLFRIDSTVVGRNIFYNNSAFDGNNTAANAADDGAIPPDKQVLLPGQKATYANYSNYTRGVNGIIIDVKGLPTSTLTASDFRFRVGDNNNPNTWETGPTPTQILVRPGAGAAGSDRIEITFADGSVKNEWLEVTLLSTGSTGLGASDVFYFGNLGGETGDDPNNARVNALDLGRTKAHLNETANISSPYDHNHDGRINALDIGAIKVNLNRSIHLIQPVGEDGGPPAATSLLTGVVTGSATQGLFSATAV
jgi:hypothetical protein